MKIRIQFAKYGRMLYIGHLDVMRFFQKALRRADIDMVFTKGFSPHPVLSFAAPLGVGIESQAEYADLEVSQSESSARMIARMNAVMVPGMEILDWRLLPDDAPNAMSSVAAADYCLCFREGKEPENWEEYCTGLEEFLKRDVIEAEKEGKKTSRIVDIRPWIYEAKADRKDHCIYLQVSTGSKGNLKPELVLSAYHQASGQKWDERDLFISRLETYTDLAKEGEERKIIPLREVGRVIE